MANHNHETIILGAWGCGIFGNDPVVVANLFNESIKENQYFKEIIFAIYDNKESITYKAFEEVFKCG